jgi:hypothetical protein
MRMGRMGVAPKPHAAHPDWRNKPQKELDVNSFSAPPWHRHFLLGLVPARRPQNIPLGLSRCIPHGRREPHQRAQVSTIGRLAQAEVLGVAGSSIQELHVRGDFAFIVI